MAIVIVDDSATNLIVLKRMAGGQSAVPVIAFSSSKAALDHLVAHTADLIIVDCEMPELGGIELISRVRAVSHHCETPIVMVTHHSASEVRREALAAGATEFLSKPVDASEFKVRVRNLLRLRGHRAIAIG